MADDHDGLTPDARDADFAAVYVSALRLVGFRGIEDLAIELESELTLLVGANNVGKSRVLRALALALRAVPADRDDLTVDGPAECFVDVIVAPWERDQDGDALFDDRVAGKLGRSAVETVSENPIEERFGWRTRVIPSREGFGVRVDQVLLTYDQTARSWVESALTLTPEQRSLMSADLIETQRDLADDLSRRGSAVRRVLDDLELPEEQRERIESELGLLGSQIVSSSAALGGIKESLDALRDTVDGIGTAAIQPLPIRIEELARSVSVDLDSGRGSLPLRFHGAGARSLASLQVQSVLYDRRMGRDGPSLRPRPLTIVEEPESHLHPQAQFELAGLLQKLRGQVVVSSHSTHLATVTPPTAIRMLRLAGSRHEVVDLKPAGPDEAGEVPRARRPTLYQSEMEKIKRLVERPFGELLFASLVIIGDGATERAFLPPLLRHVFSTRAHGICVVDPGSMKNDAAKAVVKFANLVGLPWLLFTDSDGEGQDAAREIVSVHGVAGEGEHVVWVSSEGAAGRGSATEKMLHGFDPQMCARACAEFGFPCTPEDSLAVMKNQKGGIGSILADQLVKSRAWVNREAHGVGYWPTALEELCDKLSALLPRREGWNEDDRAQ